VGKAVTTLEGLAGRLTDGTIQLHPVQQAFLEHPLQCGWCLCGHVMTAAALLAETPHPSTEQIEESVVVCQCEASMTATYEFVEDSDVQHNLLLGLAWLGEAGTGHIHRLWYPTHSDLYVVFSNI